MKKILEGIKNFGYTPPEDPELLLYDFYFIAGFLSGKQDDPIIDFIFKEAASKCTINLQKHMLRALRWALSAEMAHVFDATELADGYLDPDEMAKRFDERFRKFLADYYMRLTRYGTPFLAALTGNARGKEHEKDAERTLGDKSLFGRTPDKIEPRDRDRKGSFIALNSFQKANNFSDEQMADLFEEAFTELQWEKAYGGSNWAKIANAYRKLLQANTLTQRIIWIDHAYDLQHNTGSVFTKVKTYYKQQKAFRWISQALDWKKEAKDVRGFYDKVSPQLRPVVAWIAKNTYDTTMEGIPSSIGEKKPSLTRFEKGKGYKYIGPAGLTAEQLRDLIGITVSPAMMPFFTIPKFRKCLEAAPSNSSFPFSATFEGIEDSPWTYYMPSNAKMPVEDLYAEEEETEKSKISIEFNMQNPASYEELRQLLQELEDITTLRGPRNTPPTEIKTSSLPSVWLVIDLELELIFFANAPQGIVKSTDEFMEDLLSVEPERR